MALVRSHVRWHLTPAMFVALALSGCTADDGESIAMLSGDPVIFVADTEFGYLTGISGTISYDHRTGCLLLQSPSRNGVVWPREVTALVTADGRRGVEHPEFGSLVEGDSVLLRGVAVSADAAGDSDVGDARQVYDECGLEEPRSSVIRIAEVLDVN